MVPANSSGSEASPHSEQQTILGIVVHLIGLPLSVIGVGVVYLLSDADFTRENAQNALNWQIFFTISLIISLLFAFGLGEFVSNLFVFIGALIIIIVGFLNVVFSLWATIKAIGGNEWAYPIAPRFV